MGSIEPADEFASALKAYLATTLHVDVVVSPWEGATELPIFLARRYRFYQASIASRRCLFATSEETARVTPADIAKNIAHVEKAFDGIVAFAASRMTSTMRARLIAQGIPFAVPGNQLYIPQLAIDLREYFRARADTSRDRLTPAAQAVLFDHILRRRDQIATASQHAVLLQYSAMTIGRAYDELASHNFASVERAGRTKRLHFKLEGRILLDQCRTLLRSPVRARYAVQLQDVSADLPLAGESALSALTNLAPPSRPTFAIYAEKRAEAFKRYGIRELRDDFDGNACIEIWRYDPRALSDGATVDPLSLHAQFWDHVDERVAEAAMDVLERVSW